jgi:hypothetical protein
MGADRRKKQPADTEFHRVHTKHREKIFVGASRWWFLNFDRVLRGRIGVLRAQRNRFLSQ